MSRRNDYDYFDLDNFDDSIDSREYRRRQQQRRSASYAARPSSQRPVRRPVKRRNKRRTRNRIIIVVSALVILFVIIFIITSIFKGCSKDDALASVPTGTVGTTASPDETAKSSTANKADELSPTYFMTPSIKDDNTNGTLSYGIYVWNKIGYELFSSDDARAQNYAQTINGFADKFGSSVKVYDMIVPNHTEMGLPQRLKDSDAPSTSQADNIKAAYAALSDKVTPINCYNRLAEHNTDYIYFKSDHHWTGLCSYHA